MYKKIAEFAYTKAFYLKLFLSNRSSEINLELRIHTFQDTFDGEKSHE